MKKIALFFLLTFSAQLGFCGVVFADQDFIDPGTFEWQVPAGVNRVQVKLWGAGGAGGTGKKIDNSHRAGQGGGAGGYIEQIIDVVPGARYTVIVGRGGLADASRSFARGGEASEFFLVGNRSQVIGAGGGGGGTSYVWDENNRGDNGTPADFGGAGGSVDAPAKGGRGYVGVVATGEVGGDGAVVRGDDRNNPYATSGGVSPLGGSGGARGRLGSDGSGHCGNSGGGGFLGLPWWATPVPILIVDELTSSGDCRSDRNIWTKPGGYPGGGGGGSDTGLGASGANGKVSIVTIPTGNPGNGGNSPTPVPPSNPVTPQPEPVRRSSSGGYNQASVGIVSQARSSASVNVPTTLASAKVTLTEVPYTGPVEDIKKALLFIGLFFGLVIATPLIFVKTKKS